MKKILALLLVLAMLASLCACGAAETSTAETSAASTAGTAESATVEDTAPAADTAPAEDSASAEETSAITYPLEGSPSFTLTCIMRNNVLAVLGDDDFSVTSAYKGITEATGCTIDFNPLGEATAEEKINIMVAGGDMTDMYTNFGTYGQNLQGAIQDGILFDLVPYLEENAPDYLAMLESDPAVKASVTNGDGTICKFTSQAVDAVTKGILVRQDWLDDLGMEAPTNREDLEKVLHAFQSEKGATMPILVNSGLETGLAHSFNVVYAGLRGVDFQLTEPDGTQVVANLASDNFIEYLLYMNHLYNEGLIIDDFMSTGREQGTWESSYYGGKSGVWADGYRELDPTNRANADDPNYVVSAMALTDYECHVSDRSTVSMDGVIFVTTACENPEGAIQFLNWCYTEEGRKNNNFGKLGEGYTEDEAGNISLTENITNSPNGWSFNNALTWHSAAQWLPTCVDMDYYKLICATETYEGIEYWTEAYGDKSMKLPSGVSLGAEETTEFNSLASDVLTLFSENAVKVVIGQLDEAGYREVIEQANEMGLTRMTELYQEALDAYLAG